MSAPRDCHASGSGTSKKPPTVMVLERTLAETKAKNEKLMAERDELTYSRAIEKLYPYTKHSWQKSEHGRIKSPESVNIYDLGFDSAKWNSYVDWMAGAPPMDTNPSSGLRFDWPKASESQPGPKNRGGTHAF